MSKAFSGSFYDSNRGNTNYQSSAGGGSSGGGGGSWGTEAYSGKQGQAVKGANSSAPSSKGFHPLAKNPDGKTLGFLGRVCDKAKEKWDKTIEKVSEIEKPDWLNGGTIVAAIGIGAIVIAAGALIAATGGLAAPVIAAAAIGLGAAGAATTTMGVFDMVEGATGKNKLKENVFKGNETAYNTVELLLVTTSIAGIITLAPHAAAGYSSLFAAKEAVGQNIVGTNYSTFKPTQDTINPSIVEGYKTKIQNGEAIPAIEVNSVAGKGDYIIDGHHRFVASQMMGKDIDMIINKTGGPVGLPDWSEVTWDSFIPE